MNTFNDRVPGDPRRRTRRSRRGPPRLADYGVQGNAMSAATVSQLPWMWLVSRASGLMLLVLFSTVFVLGISTRLGAQLRSMPRCTLADSSDSGPVLRGAPRSPRGDCHARSLRIDRMVGGRPALHRSLQVTHGESRRIGSGSRSSRSHHQLGPETAGPPVVACGALAGLRIVAAGLHAFAQRRERHEHLVGRHAGLGLRQRRCSCRGRPDPLFQTVPEEGNPAAELGRSRGRSAPVQGLDHELDTSADGSKGGGGSGEHGEPAAPVTQPMGARGVGGAPRAPRRPSATPVI